MNWLTLLIYLCGSGTGKCLDTGPLKTHVGNLELRMKPSSKYVMLVDGKAFV